MTQETSNTKYIDYLTEDEPLPGQLWVCISFLSPEGIKNCSVRGLKIRGVYGTKQEADQRAKSLQERDPDFHVFVGEMGKWLPWDPDPNDVSDNQYQEKELNDLMKGYKDNLDKAKRMQQQRKEDMIRQAAKEEQSRDQKARDRMKKKLETRKQQKDTPKIEDVEELNQVIKDTKQFEEQFKKDDEMLKAERERIGTSKKELEEKTKVLETVDSKLARIQALYEKINKKQ